MDWRDILLLVDAFLAGIGVGLSVANFIFILLMKEEKEERKDEQDN